MKSEVWIPSYNSKKKMTEGRILGGGRPWLTIVIWTKHIRLSNIAVEVLITKYEKLNFIIVLIYKLLYVKMQEFMEQIKEFRNILKVAENLCHVYI